MSLIAPVNLTIRIVGEYFSPRPSQNDLLRSVIEGGKK